MSPRNRWLLTAGTVGILGGGLAYAQTSSPDDARQMPETKGVVAQYDLTPRGDVDGLILTDGTEVHLPPHLSAELAAAVQPGRAVTIHGLKARALPLVQAASITDDASGRTVVDNGPGARPPRPHGPEAGEPLEAEGVVKMQLHGPRGDFNGVLLEDGTMVHLPPPEAARRVADLAVGRPVSVSGFGVKNALGESIGARRIGSGKDSMTEIAGPPPPDGPPGAPLPLRP